MHSLQTFFKRVCNYGFDKGGCIDESSMLFDTKQIKRKNQLGEALISKGIRDDLYPIKIQPYLFTALNSLVLAELYGVETKVLNQAVKRNIARFPSDFMFDLTQMEYDSLRSQIVTLNTRGAHSKYLPNVFTEQGVAMLSSVLRSPQAIQVNIQIIRVFTRIRQMVADYTTILSPN